MYFIEDSLPNQDCTEKLNITTSGSRKNNYGDLHKQVVNTVNTILETVCFMQTCAHLHSKTVAECIKSYRLSGESSSIEKGKISSTTKP